MSTTVPASQSRLYDSALQLEDGGAAFTSTAFTGFVVDMGTGDWQADLYIDVSAIDVASNDELYTIWAVGQATGTTAIDGVVLGGIQLGALAEPILADSTVGQYVIPLRGSAQLGTNYRYVELYVVCAGTSPSITFTAFLTKSANIG